MTIKLLHTSDIHLEGKFNFLGKRSLEQRNQLVATFENLIDTAISEKYNVVVISGDLFDTPHPGEVVKNKVHESLQKLQENSIYCAIISGNHDYLEKNSVFLDKSFLTFDPNFIKIFNSQTDLSWKIPSLDITIYGVSIDSKKISKSPAEKLEGVKPDTRYNVAVLHGSIETVDKTREDLLVVDKLKKLNMNYIALGDWHSTLEVSKSPAIWYSGSPELINVNQLGAGNFLEVIIDQNTTTVSPKNIGTKQALKIEVDVTGVKTLLELKNKIISKLPEQKSNILVNLKLIGVRSIDADFQITELNELISSEVYYLKIEDKSKLELTDEELAKFPEEFLVGKYIRLLKAKKGEDYSQNQIIDEAIQLGVKLLKNK